MKFKRLPNELVVVLEDPAVSSVGVEGTSSLLGSRSARAMVLLLATILSLSPFATSAG